MPVEPPQPSASPDAPDVPDLRCPVCAAPLVSGERAFTCANGHSFDRARQGYVNLLRPTRLRGDTPEMLRARRRFLDAGWYAPLADALTEMVGAWLAEDGEALSVETHALLDAGCGEGYYLGALASALAPTLDAGGWRLYGLDLSKDAVRMAAARSRRVTWVVASSKDRLPFGDAGLGALLCVFAPRDPEEFARVVAPGGSLLVVTPASEHLAEARAALPWLLTPEPAKDERLRATLDGAFALAEARPISFSLALDAAALTDLAEMTPHRPVEPAEREAAVQAAVTRADGGRLIVRVSCVARRYFRHLRRGSASA